MMVGNAPGRYQAASPDGLTVCGKDGTQYSGNAIAECWSLTCTCPYLMSVPVKERMVRREPTLPLGTIMDRLGIAVREWTSWIPGAPVRDWSLGSLLSGGEECVLLSLVDSVGI